VPENALYALAVFPGAAGLIVVIMAVIALRARAALRELVRVRAVVVAFEDHLDIYYKARLPHPVIEFALDGVAQRAVLVQGFATDRNNHPRLRIGESIDVYVDPSDPAEARAPQPVLTPTIILVGLTMLAAAIVYFAAE
jgi:hypothetical protein